MINLYYTVEPHMKHQDGDLYENDGYKTITIYDIDTQYVSIIEVAQFTVPIDKLSEEEISVWLENDGGFEETDWNLIKL